MRWLFRKIKKIKPIRSFTFVELLVVTTIIILLTTIGIVSYSLLAKQGRDARRKSDIDDIRGVSSTYYLENSSYPRSLNQLLPKYLKSIPLDPKTKESYTYTAIPGTCDGTSTNPCTSYNLEANLDTGLVYQTDPYGGVTATVTPTIIPSPTLPLCDAPDLCQGYASPPHPWCQCPAEGQPGP